LKWNIQSPEFDTASFGGAEARDRREARADASGRAEAIMGREVSAMKQLQDNVRFGIIWGD
jgi:hypothetical protein